MPAIKKNATSSKKIQGIRSPFPKNIKPMLATLVDAPFDVPGWLYEIKWDGYRALSYLDKGKVDIRSRNDKSFNEKFYSIYDAMTKWKLNAVMDGEIIVANKEGKADFGDLQNWRSEADGILQYYVFDILYLDGRSLMDLPLMERRKILIDVLPKSNVIKLSETVDTKATVFFETAKKMGLEGIMAKKADSEYIPGDRSGSG